MHLTLGRQGSQPYSCSTRWGHHSHIVSPGTYPATLATVPGIYNNVISGCGARDNPSHIFPRDNPSQIFPNDLSNPFQKHDTGRLYVLLVLASRISSFYQEGQTVGPLVGCWSNAPGLEKCPCLAGLQQCPRVLKVRSDPGLKQCPAIQGWRNETLGTGVIEAPGLLKRYLEQGTISGPMSAWAGHYSSPDGRITKPRVHTACSCCMLHAFLLS